MKKDTIQTRNRKKNSKKKKLSTKSLGISSSQDFVVVDKTPSSLYGPSLSARSQYSHHSVCSSTILPSTYLGGNSQHLIPSFTQKNAVS